MISILEINHGQKKTKLILAFVMTRLGKPFPLQVTWDCVNNCKQVDFY